MNINKFVAIYDQITPKCKDISVIIHDYDMSYSIILRTIIY